MSSERAEASAMGMNVVLGNQAEELAAVYLTDRGYTILERKYRSPRGEIDLIARHEDTVVFVEVKYRRDLKYGYPREAVGFRKQRVILNTARYYIGTKQLTNTDFRFDVIEILGQEDPVIEQIENAF